MATLLLWPLFCIFGLPPTRLLYCCVANSPHIFKLLWFQPKLGYSCTFIWYSSFCGSAFLLLVSIGVHSAMISFPNIVVWQSLHTSSNFSGSSIQLYFYLVQLFLWKCFVTLVSIRVHWAMISFPNFVVWQTLHTSSNFSGSSQS